MALPREEQVKIADLIECQGCSQQNVIARLSHHFGLLERPSDSHPQMMRLKEHLTKIYGQDYVESGKLKRRLDFVRAAWLIWRDQLLEGKLNLTISEAYNLAALRLNWKRSRKLKVGIEKSQPREGEN